VAFKIFHKQSVKNEHTILFERVIGIIEKVPVL
jgi:hypothetical protein